MFNYAFEKLEVWQESRKLTKGIYQITTSYPKSEAFGLVNQIRRAAVSVCSNIAEGSARTSFKDQAYFYQISYSSLMEVLCQLIISSDLGYLPEGIYQENRRIIDKIARQISKLRSSALARIEKKN